MFKLSEKFYFYIIILIFSFQNYPFLQEMETFEMYLFANKIEVF
ncbi:hypothetical protein QIW_1750 [Clostridioides difficile DA00134]|nr:hypothetical protein QIW_1750 [Clostridioides difficile DA00134]EQG53081.1 hypothetical protein QIY_1636 [Clostridioides difficile DA00141]